MVHLCTPVLLASCAVNAPPTSVVAPLPNQWQAPLPHNGTIAGLSQWWQQHGDPVLTQLIDAAQAASPTIASAKSRIEQARAARVAAGAALQPSLDASVNATRGRTDPTLPLGSVLQGGLQSAWELDLFGANRYGNAAAQARLEGARAEWHGARVSVAAEVANQYYSLRTCEKLLAITRSDAESRAETSRLTQLAAEAGFQAPATAALARASAAEGSSRVTQQQAQCELDVKALVALTALPEPELRQRLAAAPADFPQSINLAIDNLPARVLSQRPDIFSAEREVAAASADAGSASAQRYPRLTLNGSIGAARLSSGGVDASLTTWSIGPLALSMPLFDGGRRAAAAEAAQARYEEAVVLYKSRARQAVREVEEALVNLQSTGARSNDAVTAVEGYRAAFAGIEARYRNGAASLIELEEMRRTRLGAELSLASLQRERVAAWIALYRAAGGGWNTEVQAATTLAARP